VQKDFTMNPSVPA